MAGKLLSAPLSTPSSVAESRFPRAADASNGPNAAADFRLPAARSFQRQYFHLYAARLNALRPRILDAAKGLKVRHVALCDLDEHRGKEGNVLIVGTLFKHQPMKPNILKVIDVYPGLIAVHLCMFTGYER